MAIAKVIFNGITQMDVTQDTVASSNLLYGETATKNDGTSVTGSIASKSSSDLTASGATVTAPAGYYASSASKAVASGSATTPATTITANPSISVSSGGLITATASASQSITPTVSAGYVSSGTAGTVSVSGSNTSQLTTQGAQTITPTASAQTIASGKYLTGNQTIEGVVCTNLTAANIVSGVTVKVGTATDDDSVASVTGTASSGYDEATIRNLIERSNLLTSFEIPSGTTAIGYGCFYGCSRLSSVNIPSTVSRINAYVFYRCYDFDTNALPDAITSIGNNAFQQCNNLSISSLPSSLTNIGSNAFWQCNKITISVIPSGVTTINTGAFQQCASIKSISSNAIITTLQYSSFNGSSSYPMSLKTARFPYMALTSNIGTVFGSGTAADACQQLELADLGSTTGIAANAFANCYKLQTLILRKSTVATLASVSAFTNTPMSGYNSLIGTVYVPSSLISSYQTETNWSTLYNNGTVTFSAIEGSDYELD